MKLNRPTSHADITLSEYKELSLSDQTLIFSFNRGYAIMEDGSLKTVKSISREDCLPYKEYISVMDHAGRPRRVSSGRLRIFGLYGLDGLYKVKAKSRGLWVFDGNNKQFFIAESVKELSPRWNLPKEFMLAHTIHRTRSDIEPDGVHNLTPRGQNKGGKNSLNGGRIPHFMNDMLSMYDKWVVTAYREGWRVQIRAGRLYNIITFKVQPLDMYFKIAKDHPAGPLCTIDLYMFMKYGFDYFRPTTKIQYGAEVPEVKPHHVMLKHFKLVEMSGASFYEYKLQPEDDS